MLAVIAFACRASAPRHVGGYVTALLIAMIFGATLGVIARGALLPEGFVGEKSLLFRWHYLQAASEIVNAHTLTGVGPAMRLAVRFALCVAALALGPAMFIEWQALIPIDVFVRGLALAGYIAVATMIAG
jgi:hypothetical protein